MTTITTTSQNGALRASDADRDKALGLLRDHWLAGRLSVDEYEARCEEAAGGCFIGELRWSLRELPYPLPEHGVAGLTHAPPATPIVAPPRAPETKAILSVVLGAGSVFSAWVPFFFLATLPVSLFAWWCGRRVSRADRALVHSGIRTTAAVGEVFAIIGTVMSLLALGACGMLMSAA
jgi:hypothetical protein